MIQPEIIIIRALITNNRNRKWLVEWLFLLRPAPSVSNYFNRSLKEIILLSRKRLPGKLFSAISGSFFITSNTDTTMEISSKLSLSHNCKPPKNSETHRERRMYKNKTGERKITYHWRDRWQSDQSTRNHSTMSRTTTNKAYINRNKGQCLCKILINVRYNFHLEILMTSKTKRQKDF